MIGNNEIKFNQATMCKAASHYLRSIMVPPVPEVTQIKYEKNGHTETFILCVKSPDLIENGK